MDNLLENFLLMRAHNIKTSLGWDLVAISSHEHGQEKNSDTDFIVKRRVFIYVYIFWARANNYVISFLIIFEYYRI
jgi:hypothetical protein